MERSIRKEFLSWQGHLITVFKFQTEVSSDAVRKTRNESVIYRQWKDLVVRCDGGVIWDSDRRWSMAEQR